MRAECYAASPHQNRRNLTGGFFCDESHILGRVLDGLYANSRHLCVGHRRPLLLKEAWAVRDYLPPAFAWEFKAAPRSLFEERAEIDW